MKKFAITTLGASGDVYVYFIEHPTKPSRTRVLQFLIENGCEVDDSGVCYEELDQIEEITDFFRLD